MKIVIRRAFERTRQIADFVPIKAYCEATAEIEITSHESELSESTRAGILSQQLDQFVQAEVDKTLINYQPLCIVCKGRGAQVVLNKEGVCGSCVKSMSFQAAEFRADAEKKRNESKPPATGTKVGQTNI